MIAFSYAARPVGEIHVARQQGVFKSHGQDCSEHQEWKEVWAQHPEWSQDECAKAIWKDGQTDEEKPLKRTVAQIRRGLACRKCPAVRRTSLRHG